jgi:hypothetical protein
MGSWSASWKKERLRSVDALGVLARKAGQLPAPHVRVDRLRVVIQQHESPPRRFGVSIADLMIT